MITRHHDKSALHELIAEFPVTAILGPRQSGKTTLAHEFDAQHFFDLENPTDVAMLADPKLALEPLTGLIAIDEIQRIPHLSQQTWRIVGGLRTGGRDSPDRETQ